MNQLMKNKEFILEYFNALSGKVKTAEAIAHYVSDPELIQHIIFFDAAFPKYELIIEEMISEGNQIIVRARAVGKHEGAFGDIPPTYRHMNLPCAVSYIIENNKIVSHWIIADQATLMEQLGVGQTV